MKTTKALTLPIFLIILIQCAMSQPYYHWAQAFGSEEIPSNESGLDLVTDRSGNVFTTGYFDSPVSLEAFGLHNALMPQGGKDIFLNRFDNQGKMVWSHAFGYRGDDQGEHLAIDQSGTLYLMGSFQGNMDMDPSSAIVPVSSYPDNTAHFLAKFDANGNLISAKRFGSGEIHISSFALDPLGNIYIAGTYTGHVNLDFMDNKSGFTAKGMSDVFIGKFAPDHSVLWVESLGGIWADEAEDLAIRRDGKIYLTGTFQKIFEFPGTIGANQLFSRGGKDIFFAHFRSDGDLHWVTHLGGSNDEEGSNIVILPSQEIVVAGNFLSQNLRVDTSLTSPVFQSRGGWDIFFAKYTRDASLIWARQIGNPFSERVIPGKGLDIDAFDEIYLGGNFDQITDFDPGPRESLLVSEGGNDMFFAGYKSNGDIKWAASVGSPHEDKLNVLHTDLRLGICLAGHFYQQIDFGTSGKSVIFQARRSQDFFTATYVQDPRSINPLPIPLADGRAPTGSLRTSFEGEGSSLPVQGNMGLYPNPASDRVTIEGQLSADKESEFLVVVRTLEGRKVRSHTGKLSAGHYREEILLDQLAPGIYLLEIKSAAATAMNKLVVRR